MSCCIETVPITTKTNQELVLRQVQYLDFGLPDKQWFALTAMFLRQWIRCSASLARGACGAAHMTGMPCPG